jgi:RimJ/RimL family protein N-acetyltransferase
LSVTYILEPKEKIKDFVTEQIRRQFPCEISEDFYRTIGAVNDDGQLIAGLVFHDIKILSHGMEAEISLAGDGKVWMTRRAIRLFLVFAFVHLDCCRIVASVHPNNNQSIKLIEKFGFELEGRLRDRAGPGEDILIYSMLRRDNKWLSKNL